MKENDIDNLIDRLQGFDGDELQRVMTDGLDSWCRHRRQRSRTVKRTLLLALLLLTSTAIAMTALPMLRPARQTPSSPAPSPAPRSVMQTVATEVPADSAAAPKAKPEPVDYYYTGVAEDGYSVTYGHDSRTLTYTRYSGGHLIHSVIHDSPNLLFTDTAAPEPRPAEAAPQPERPAATLVACDFQTVSPQGDALYYVVLDSVRRTVSVRGDVARWMGQPIRYNTVLMLPATVEHDSVLYTVTAVADSAFMGHDELVTVCLPATVTRIGDYAFAGCRALGTLVVHATTPPEAFPASFDHVDAQLLLTVPCGSRQAYENDVEWLYFSRVTDACSASAPSIRVVRKP